jgi:hypothetical protein
MRAPLFGPDLGPIRRLPVSRVLVTPAVTVTRGKWVL